VRWPLEANIGEKKVRKRRIENQIVNKQKKLSFESEVWSVFDFWLFRIWFKATETGQKELLFAVAAQDFCDPSLPCCCCGCCCCCCCCCHLFLPFAVFEVSSVLSLHIRECLPTKQRVGTKLKKGEGGEFNKKSKKMEKKNLKRERERVKVREGKRGKERREERGLSLSHHRRGR